jgi:hypothetical protein
MEIQIKEMEWKWRMGKFTQRPRETVKEGARLRQEILNKFSGFLF